MHSRLVEFTVGKSCKFSPQALDAQDHAGRAGGESEREQGEDQNGSHSRVCYQARKLKGVQRIVDPGVATSARIHDVEEATGVAIDVDSQCGTPANAEER